MRRGTVVSHSLRSSCKLARISDEGRLFFLMLLLAVDAYGRIDAQPITLHAEVWPAWGKTLKRTENALSELAKVGLIVVYDTDHSTLLQVEGWEKHVGSSLRKRGAESLPGPKSGVVRSGTEKCAAFPRPPSTPSASGFPLGGGAGGGGLDFAKALAERQLDPALAEPLSEWWAVKKGMKTARSLGIALTELSKMPPEIRRERIDHSYQGKYPGLYQPNGRAPAARDAGPDQKTLDWVRDADEADRVRRARNGHA